MRHSKYKDTSHTVTHGKTHQTIVALCVPLFHSSLSGGLCPTVHLWPPSISSSLDKKLLLPTLTKPCLTTSLQYDSNSFSRLISEQFYFFFFLQHKIVIINSAPQLATGPSVQADGKNAIRAMLSGASHNVVKPLLATEVRRIMPTAAGLPMELSLVSAAVASAAVQGQ